VPGGRRLPRGATAAVTLAAALAPLLGACAGRTPPPRVDAPPPAVVPPPGAGVPAVPAPADPAAPAPVPDAPRVRPSGGEGDRRFQLVAADDSTVSFLAPREPWVREGMYGIAVDPARRDALVARLYVLARSADTTVALVTGQTTRMSAEYVAIFRRPTTPMLRQQSFWGGLAAGIAVGLGAAIALLRGR
jgi:hypothetical protein